MLLEGKTALVTGASQGIGKGIARILNKKGAKIYIIAWSADKLSTTAKELDPTGKEVFAVPCDITSNTAVEEVFKRFKADGISIDILVNAAGTANSNSIETTDIELWDKVLDTNLTAAFNLSQKCFLMMKEKGGGKIINLASILANVTSPGMAAYSASKAAVKMLTKTQAVEWAKYNIQSNAIAPGYIKTDMTKGILNNQELTQRLVSRTPMGRIGEPEDVAKVALFLASPLSDFVTGTEIPVDGGILASLM